MAHNYCYISKTLNVEFTFRTYNVEFTAIVAVQLLADGDFKIRNLKFYNYDTSNLKWPPFAVICALNHVTGCIMFMFLYPSLSFLYKRKW
jgi:hypothetical protein